MELKDRVFIGTTSELKIIAQALINIGYKAQLLGYPSRECATGQIQVDFDETMPTRGFFVFNHTDVETSTDEVVIIKERSHAIEIAKQIESGSKDWYPTQLVD